jgi:hypothetical protein
MSQISFIRILGVRLILRAKLPIKQTYWYFKVDI